jgi:hypothetical protein
MAGRTKATLQIKQAMIELTLQHPNFADLQITGDDDADQLLIELVERYGRRWKLGTQQLNDFAESECKDRWLFLTNLNRATYSRIVTHEI